MLRYTWCRKCGKFDRFCTCIEDEMKKAVNQKVNAVFQGVVDQVYDKKIAQVVKDKLDEVMKKMAGLPAKEPVDPEKGFRVEQPIELTNKETGRTRQYSGYYLKYGEPEVDGNTVHVPVHILPFVDSIEVTFEITDEEDEDGEE